MILSASQESKIQRANKKINLRSLIKECNQKIINEKELLYNFNFSAVEANNDFQSDIEKESFLPNKNENEDNQKSFSVAASTSNETLGKKPNQKFIPNIFKDKVKAYLKNKNFF